MCHQTTHRPWFSAIYAQNKGTLVTGQTVSKPSFEDFKQQVAAGRNSIVSAIFYGSPIGHSMCAQGYAIATKKATGQAINTLVVADVCLVKPEFRFGAGTAFPYLAARLRGPSSACIVGGSSSPASA